MPRAREVVAQRSTDLLEKLVSDIRLGQSFEVERVEEIVDDMVESIVRNPDALMWVARLREQDITHLRPRPAGRRCTSPRSAATSASPSRSSRILAQVGLLLDVGKIRLPRELLEKQGRLTGEEFEAAKAHVQHGLDILVRRRPTSTPR